MRASIVQLAAPPVIHDRIAGVEGLTVVDSADEAVVAMAINRPPITKI